MTAVDRASPLPLYFQLKHILTQEIARKGPGDLLPGDHALCETYGVSRTVVRQALTELEFEGVIERVKGKGTYVAFPRTSERLVQSLTGLYEDVAARGGHLRSEVRHLEVVEADARVATELGLEAGAPVVLLERLRLVDEQPWALSVSHLPHYMVPGLESEDLSDQSLYALLERRFGVRLARGRRSVGAILATRPLSQALGVAVGAPVLELRSLSVDAADRPVETFVAYHRGDRSRFDVDLLRESSRPSRPTMVLTPPEPLSTA